MWGRTATTVFRWPSPEMAARPQASPAIAVRTRVRENSGIELEWEIKRIGVAR